MQIQNNHNGINYTGSAARPLKGLFMSADWCGIASELKQLEPNTGLKVFCLNDKFDVSTESFLHQDKLHPLLLWVQDTFSFVDDKLFPDFAWNPLKETIKSIGSKLQKTFNLTLEKHNYHLQGGNYILNKSGDTSEILVGKYDLRDISKSCISERFNVDKVIEIPQVAAHLDAFMFVDGKRAFVCDDNLMLNHIAQSLNKIQDYIISNYYYLPRTEIQKFLKINDYLLNLYKNFQLISSHSPYAKADEAIRVLENNGYEVVKIPARLYAFIQSYGQTQHQYGTNFANAILHKNKVGDTVLITNESANDIFFGIDKEVEEKIGFSFKKIFLDSISPYIKRENVHFIKGKDNQVTKLLENLGGVHCASTEII